jgi:hypothetical protein
VECPTAPFYLSYHTNQNPLGYLVGYLFAIALVATNGNPGPIGYPGSVLRSTSVREMTSLRRVGCSPVKCQINSNRYILVFKSPQHTLPKKVTKKKYILEIEPLLKKSRGAKRALQAPILR